MSSGVICHIELDTKLQQFLKSYFNQTGILFKFPRKDEFDLGRKFKRLLSPPPENFIKYKKTDRTFDVELPYDDEKPPLYNFYITPRSQAVFSKKVRAAFGEVFRGEMMKYYSEGFEYKECVGIFMEAFEISDNHYETLLKDYQRWRARVRKQKERRKQKKMIPVHA